MKKNNGYWDYDACYQEALKYKTRTEFSKGCEYAYRKATKMGWIDDYYWFERKLNPYTENMDCVYAYFFYDSKSVYVGRSIDIKRRDWEHRNAKYKSTVYKFAKQNNVPIPEMSVIEEGLSIADGLDKENYYVAKFKKEGWNVLNKAKTGVNSGALGILSNSKLSCKYCYEIATKCKTLAQLYTEYPSVYAKANAKGWIKTYYWLEKTDISPKPVVQFSLDGILVNIYSGVREAEREIGRKGGHIGGCCRKDYGFRSAYGFKWMFLDDYLADWWDTQMDIAA